MTATKREESLQDVPIAVTAITPLQIERAGMLDMRDLPTLASSFNMNSSQTESQGTTLRIRGVGTTGNNIGLPADGGVSVVGPQAFDARRSNDRSSTPSIRTDSRPSSTTT